MPVNNGIITPAVGLGDISKAIHLSSQDLGTLCRSATVNRWSKYKPFRDPAPGYATPALNMAAAKAASYGFRMSDDLALSDINPYKVFTYACQNRYTWLYKQPRGKDYNEAYRAGDFAYYNHNAKGYPLGAVLQTNSQGNPQLVFTHPAPDDLPDIQIKDFPWFTASVKGSKDNWKYGVMYGRITNPSTNPSRVLGNDIYTPGGAYVDYVEPDNGTPDVGDLDNVGDVIVLTDHITFRRGYKYYFVPFITRLSGDSGNNYTDSVYIHLPYQKHLLSYPYPTDGELTDLEIQSISVRTEPSSYTSGGKIKLDFSVDFIPYPEKEDDRDIDVYICISNATYRTGEYVFKNIPFNSVGSEQSYTFNNVELEVPANSSRDTIYLQIRKSYGVLTEKIVFPA